jgi:uncharacterized membrane protein
MSIKLDLPFSLPRLRLPDIALPKPKLPRPRLPRWMHKVGWRTVVGGALVGGVIHICATFAAPVFGSGHAFDQLRGSLPLNKMVVLAPPAPGRQILPFLPPDMLYAMCRYELTGGPVSLTAAVTGPGWLLSLHTPQGDNFYVLPGQQLKRGEVSFLVVPGGTLDAGSLQRNASPADTQVASPTAEGLIVVRAPIIGLAWLPQTDALLRRSSCTQVKR